MTLFETDTPVAGRAPAGARAEVVVRTPAPSGPTGTFVSVVVVADHESAQVERDLADLDAALSAVYPVHEVVLVLKASRGRIPWGRALAERQANLQVLGLLHDVNDEVAYTAGIDGALGDVVVTARLGVDAPADVVRCASMVTEETAVVVGVDAAGTSRRRLAVRLGRAVVRHSLGEDSTSVTLGLRGYSRAALDAWLPRRDRDRVLRVLPTISGYPSTVLHYSTGARTGLRSRRSTPRDGWSSGGSRVIDGHSSPASSPRAGCGTGTTSCAWCSTRPPARRRCTSARTPVR